MTSIKKEPYQQYITDLLDLEDSALRKKLETRKFELTAEDWKFQRSVCLETLLKVYTGRTFKSATFAWLLLDNRVHTKTIIQKCLEFILATNDLRYYTLVDWLRKFNKENAVGVEFPQTFSINLNYIWDFGLSNETELEGKTTANETLFRMEIDESSETKRNELINLEQLAMNIGDGDDNVGQLLYLFTKEFLIRGTSDLWKKCMKHLLQPIHIDGVKMMLELNHKHHDYVEQWNLQATMLRMVYNDDGQIRGSDDEFIEVVQLIDSYANSRKPNNFENKLIASEDKKKKMKDFLGRFEIQEQITPGRPEDINY